MRNKLSNVIWGILFIFIGIGIAGNVMDLWYFDFWSLIFDEGLWTLFIIIPCAVSIIRGGFQTGSIIGFIIGVMLLASYHVDFRFDFWQLIVPVVLVSIGLRIIFQGSIRRTYRSEHKVHVDGPYDTNQEKNFTSAPKGEYTAIFASNHVRLDDSFTGTNLSAVFGGLVLDIRDAIITGDVTINATAVFGGIDIYVPRDVIVKVNNVPVFGGVSNKTGYQAGAGAPVIYLKSTTMFGGIDIK